MAGITARFPNAAAFAPQRAIVASVETLLQGFNARWRIRLDFAEKVRAAPRTLTPRKGPTPAQPTEAEVIAHFTRGRDMFALDDGDVAAIGQTLVTDAIAAVQAGRPLPTASTYMLRFANLAKGLWIHRWERGGDGLPLKPLSARYVSYKRRLGYSSKIGHLTGQSLAALKRVRVVAVRA